MKEKLCLLHGWGMHHGIWGNCLGGIADSVKALDLPGHGARTRGERMESMVSVLSQLDIEPGVWIGWSLGGQVLLSAALERPEDCRALILVASTPRFVADTAWVHGMPAQVFSEFANALETDHRGTLERFAALEVHGSDTARRDLPAIRERMHRFAEPARSTLRDGLTLLHDTDLRHRLVELEMPALWICGSRDRLVPPAAGVWAATQMTRGQSVTMDKCGHAPFLGHPNRFRHIVEEFLQSAL